MARRKIIPNGTVMRWNYNRNYDVYLTVKILDKVPRKKGQWQKYVVVVLDEGKYQGKNFHAAGNRLFKPIPKFNTAEEAEAWLEQQR